MGGGETAIAPAAIAGGKKERGREKKGRGGRAMSEGGVAPPRYPPTPILGGQPEAGGKGQPPPRPPHIYHGRSYPLILSHSHMPNEHSWPPFRLHQKRNLALNSGGRIAIRTAGAHHVGTPNFWLVLKKKILVE